MGKDFKRFHVFNLVFNVQRVFHSRVWNPKELYLLPFAVIKIRNFTYFTLLFMGICHIINETVMKSLTTSSSTISPHDYYLLNRDVYDADNEIKKKNYYWKTFFAFLFACLFFYCVVEHVRFSFSRKHRKFECSWLHRHLKLNLYFIYHWSIIVLMKCCWLTRTSHLHFDTLPNDC